MSTRMAGSIRRRFAVEYLDDGGNRLVRGVTRKSVDRQPGGVAEKSANSDLLLFGEFVIGVPSSPRASRSRRRRARFPLHQAQGTRWPTPAC